jgi:hypothetical protein
VLCDEALFLYSKLMSRTKCVILLIALCYYAIYVIISILNILRKEILTMIKFVVEEANNKFKKECFKINRYLLESDLTKDTIPNLEYSIDGVKRNVSFQKLDYYSFLKKDMKIKNPYAYFEFKLNPMRTNVSEVKRTPAFDYVLNDEKLQMKLRTDIKFVINKEDQILIIAYVEKGNEINNSLCKGRKR